MSDNAVADPADAEERFLREVQKALRQLLLDKCMSQSELARRINGSRQHVGAVLNGNHILHMRTLVRVLAAMGEEIDVGLEDGSLVIRSHPRNSLLERWAKGGV